MKLLRLWRTNDRFKLAVLLLLLTVYLLGYAGVQAGRYLRWMLAPAEYVCTYTDSYASAAAKLEGSENISAYSPQITQNAEIGRESMQVTLLSARYLSDVFGVEPVTHTVWMNRIAFAKFCGEKAENPAALTMTLDGHRTEMTAVCLGNLPEDAPYAVMQASESALRETNLMRVCVKERNSAVLMHLGMNITEPEKQTAAEYEEILMLTRVRFAVLSAALALLAAFLSGRAAHAGS